MPTVSSNATILVTGANGFIAMWVIDTLLKRGYAVRAAVRTEARGQHLLETFKSYGDKVHLVAIGDIATPGAFDEAVKGVEAVIHTAATVTTQLDHVEADEVINAAVQGNSGLLTSAQKYGTSLKRVVITSSCAARTSYTAVPKHVDENSWNDDAVDECEKLGKAANGLAKYAASKTLAERRAWEWYAANKDSLVWDLTILAPPWVFSPVLHDVKSIDELNDSNKYLYNAIIKNDFIGPSPLFAPSHGWIDARDSAELHVRALEVPDAGGEGFLTVAGQFVWQDTVDAANSLSPSPWPSHKEPFAKGLEGKKFHNIIWDTSKEKRVFGLKFRTLEETIRDILADYEAHGWA